MWGDRIALGFCAVEIGLITVGGVELDLISVSGWKLTWVLREGREILGFSVWIGIKLVFASGHRN